MAATVRMKWLGACALFQESPERQFRDVNRLVRDVLAIEGEELQRNRISVKLELAEPGAQVLCDRLQLHQVILNLVVNAVEAMSQVTDRARVLRVKTEAREQDVQITISDSGPGIGQENVEYSSRSFQQITWHGAGIVDLSDDHRKPQWSADGIVRRRPWGGLSNRFARQEAARRLTNGSLRPSSRGKAGRCRTS